MRLNEPVTQREHVLDDDVTLLSTTDARSLAQSGAAEAGQSVHLAHAIAVFSEARAIERRAHGAGHRAAPA
jgi:hypothetical protein